MTATAPRRHVVLTAGYTAGHVFPAVAVAEAWRDIEPDTAFTFVGSAEGIESGLVIDRGFDFAAIPARPVMRSSRRDAVRGLATLAGGIAAARRLLKRLAPEFVMGFGGYATPGVILAARSLRIATAIHEANAVPGRANRLAGRFTDRVYLNRAEGQERFPSRKIQMVGHPMRSEMQALADVPRAPPTSGTLNLLILGGSLGMAFLNENGPALARAISHTGIKPSVRHQTGAEAEQSVRALYGDAGIMASVVPFIEDMPEAFRWADWAVAPAGAGTLAELAVAGLPATIVPLADAADAHQDGNAAAFAGETGISVCTESDWVSDSVARHLQEISGDTDRYLKLVAALRKASTADAAEKIARSAINALDDRDASA